MVILVFILACGFPFPKPHISLPVATIAYSSDSAFLYLAGIVPSPPQITLPSDRPIFPYSIIPGGARNRRELQSALAADPVAAHHYSDFRVQSASLVRLSAARKVYVSYRLGNRVFWTKQKVTLHSGEPVLTDGTHFARARCGNRISLLPGPTSSAEPAAATLGGPVFPSRFPAAPDMLPAAPIWINTARSPEILSASTTTPLPPGPGPGPGGGFIPQPFYPPFCCGIGGPPGTAGGSGGLPQPGPPPIIIPSGPPPTAVPEPLAFTLLCAGCAALFLILKNSPAPTRSRSLTRR
jgi:hypothetical protein